MDGELTPQDYGFPDKPTAAQRDTWAHQQLFLKAFARMGKRTLAAKAAGVSREAVDKWYAGDIYTFKKRCDASHDEYVEKLEAEMDATIEAKPTNAAILQIFRLKAEHPEKYREEVKVVSNDAPALMWLKLRELAAQRPEIVEGEVKELPGGE